MKRKATLFVGIISSILIALSFVHADDATPEPGTPQENECYPGGVLYRAENQDGCPTEWYWKAGWYLAAVNNGRISRDDVPDEFKSVLPPLSTTDTPNAPTDPESTQEPEPPIGQCWHIPSGIYAYQYIGPANTLNNVRSFYRDEDCTSNSFEYLNYALVFARSEAEAQTICASLGPIDLFRTFASLVWDAPDNSYFCHVHQD